VHRKNIPIYIQQEATLRSLFYLKTALHVSGGTSTRHQERKQLYLQHMVFVRPLLLPAAIVEQLERNGTNLFPSYTYNVLDMFTPPCFFDVYTKSSFAFLPHYPTGKFPWQTLEWTHQRWSEYGDEKTNPSSGGKLGIGRPARSY
jgi:hypothetical protein